MLLSFDKRQIEQRKEEVFLMNNLHSIPQMEATMAHSWTQVAKRLPKLLSCGQILKFPRKVCVYILDECT
jgi:hypothetical protein